MSPLQLSEATLALGNAAAAAILGVDHLYRAESGDDEGLAVLDMSQGRLAAEPFADYAAAAARWQELRQQAQALPEADRRTYYDQLAHSTLTVIRWRTTGLPFAEQLAGFLHVPAEPASEATMDALKSQMRAMLNRMGYTGDIQQQFKDWEASQRVPADEVPQVLESLLSEAWDRTAARMPIPAPKSDGMRIIPVSGVSFNARCLFLKRQIELNTDPILTRPGLKHLAVHEGYPGHYVQFKTREQYYTEGWAPADNLLSVVNTASSSCFEGIGDYGLEMLDWVEDDNDRLAALLNRYRAAIGTAAAWKLHALGESVAAVTDWLRARTLAGGEGWVAGRMGFISAPARAVLIWSYWWGEAKILPAYQGVPPAQRPEFFQYLYGRMHSNQTVALFPELFPL
jgi:hypothetical protein